MTARAIVDGLRCQVFEVPTDRPEADGTLEWSSTTLVVVWVSCGRHEGMGWTYAPAASASVVDATLADLVRGSDAMGVTDLHRSMTRACRNMGVPGIAACALSAVDIALWDLKAQLLEVPLVDLFGRMRTSVPVYGSGGFTTYSDEHTRQQLLMWVEDWRIPRVKIKIAESAGREEQRDLHRVHLARETIGDRELFVDANGGYRRKQAVRIARLLADESGVSWFEEPVSSDDLDGLRLVRGRSEADVAAGEYGYTPAYFARMAGAGAVDCLQADVTRCGGYTGWLHAARIAESNQLDISGHCAPTLHTPVAAAVPNLRHVELFHDHFRIEQMLVEGSPAPDEGSLTPQVCAPGHGFRLRNEVAVTFQVTASSPGLGRLPPVPDG